MTKYIAVSTPCFSARYVAAFSMGRPSNRTLISSTEASGTPECPTSATTLGSS